MVGFDGTRHAQTTKVAVRSKFRGPSKDAQDLEVCQEHFGVEEFHCPRAKCVPCIVFRFVSSLGGAYCVHWVLVFRSSTRRPAGRSVRPLVSHYKTSYFLELPAAPV